MFILLIKIIIIIITIMKIWILIMLTLLRGHVAFGGGALARKCIEHQGP